MPNSASSARGTSRKTRPDRAGEQQADARRRPHALDRALRPAGAEVLAGDRRGRAHQPDRGPGDQREQLVVADRVGGLRLGAVFEAADEAEQQEAADVHRHALQAGRQAEAEQRADDRPVRAPAASCARTRSACACANSRPSPTTPAATLAGHRADRRAEHAEARERPGAGDQREVEREMRQRQADAEVERRARVAGRAQRAAEHEEQQHAEAAGEHQPQVGQRLVPGPPARRLARSSSHGAAT